MPEYSPGFAIVTVSDLVGQDKLRGAMCGRLRTRSNKAKRCARFGSEGGARVKCKEAGQVEGVLRTRKPLRKNALARALQKTAVLAALVGD